MDRRILLSVQSPKNSVFYDILITSFSPLKINGLCGVMSQKIEFVMTTTVKTSGPI